MIINLSPYEKNRIIKDDFGKTEMGRDLLAEDYILKQITASLIYPEENIGKKFWDKVYAQAQEQFGSTNISVNTFNKVWIVPDNALVYEKANTAYVISFHLKVMLEEDYLSLQKHNGIQTQGNRNKIHSIASNIVRQIVLPQLEKEINEGENFATLRQVFSGVILAAWFKRALKESLLGKMYVNKVKIRGVDQDPKTNEEIYRQYLRAYKKGVFNYIKEDVDKYTNQVIPRKYFSGGILVANSKAMRSPTLASVDEGMRAINQNAPNSDIVNAAMTMPTNEPLNEADAFMALIKNGMELVGKAGADLLVAIDKDRRDGVKREYRGMPIDRSWRIYKAEDLVAWEDNKPTWTEEQKTNFKDAVLGKLVHGVMDSVRQPNPQDSSAAMISLSDVVSQEPINLRMDTESVKVIFDRDEMKIVIILPSGYIKPDHRNREYVLALIRRSLEKRTISVEGHITRIVVFGNIQCYPTLKMLQDMKDKMEASEATIGFGEMQGREFSVASQDDMDIKLLELKALHNQSRAGVNPLLVIVKDRDMDLVRSLTPYYNLANSFNEKSYEWQKFKMMFERGEVESTGSLDTIKRQLMRQNVLFVVGFPNDRYYAITGREEADNRSLLFKPGPTRGPSLRRSTNELEKAAFQATKREFETVWTTIPIRDLTKVDQIISYPTFVQHQGEPSGFSTLKISSLLEGQIIRVKGINKNGTPVDRTGILSSRIIMLNDEIHLMISGGEYVFPVSQITEFQVNLVEKKALATTQTINIPERSGAAMTTPSESGSTANAAMAMKPSSYFSGVHIHPLDPDSEQGRYELNAEQAKKIFNASFEIMQEAQRLGDVYMYNFLNVMLKDGIDGIIKRFRHDSDPNNRRGSTNSTGIVTINTDLLDSAEENNDEEWMTLKSVMTHEFNHIIDLGLPGSSKFTHNQLETSTIIRTAIYSKGQIKENGDRWIAFYNGRPKSKDKHDRIGAFGTKDSYIPGIMTREYDFKEKEHMFGHFDQLAASHSGIVRSPVGQQVMNPEIMVHKSTLSKAMMNPENPVARTRAEAIQEALRRRGFPVDGIRENYVPGRWSVVLSFPLHTSSTIGNENLLARISSALKVPENMLKIEWEKHRERVLMYEISFPVDVEPGPVGEVKGDEGLAFDGLDLPVMAVGNEGEVVDSLIKDIRRYLEIVNGKAGVTQTTKRNNRWFFMKMISFIHNSPIMNTSEISKDVKKAVRKLYLDVFRLDPNEEFDVMVERDILGVLELLTAPKTVPLAVAPASGDVIIDEIRKFREANAVSLAVTTTPGNLMDAIEIIRKANAVAKTNLTGKLIYLVGTNKTLVNFQGTPSFDGTDHLVVWDENWKRETIEIKNIQSIEFNAAMTGINKRILGVGNVHNINGPGGIDFNAANLNLRIKRDGNGVPLPVSQQDMAQLAQVDGLVPVILKITPETASSSFSRLLAH